MTSLTGLIFLMGCASTPPPSQFAATAQAKPETEQTNNINIVINTKQSAVTSTGEPLVCKEYKVTGSRLKTTRSCHTAAEWDQIKRETQDNIKTMYLKHGSDHG